MSLRRAPRWLASAVAVALVGLSAVRAPIEAAEPPTEAVREMWYRVELGGEPAGWSMTRETAKGGERTTESETRLRVRRGGTVIEVALASRWVETEEGRPLALWARQELGEQPVEKSYAFAADHVDLVSEQGGRRTEQRLPLPEAGWLTPWRAARQVAGELARGASRYSYRTIDPLAGLTPFTVSGEVVARSLVLPGGKGRTRVAPVSVRVRETQSLAPEVAVEAELAADGEPLSTLTRLFGMEMKVVRVDRATALAASGAPELLVASFIRPDRPLADPRALRHAAYALTSAAGRPPLPPTAGAQSARREGDTVRVTVDAAASRSPASGSGEEEASRASYLAASTYLDHRDPAIRELVAQATAGAGEAEAERAEAMRAFVHRYLQRRDLSTAFATASEVAARRAGDCTEHSVLLAAMLRGDGIPSRVVAGLLYVEAFAGGRNVFGFHMWVQALLGDRWVDLDAVTERPFDAAHIALDTLALDDASVLTPGPATLAALAGGLRISVLDAAP